MRTIQLSLDNFETLLFIFTRVISIVTVAPFFGIRSIPTYVKIGFSFLMSLIIINTIAIPVITYDTMYGFAAILIKEIFVGWLIGFGAYLSFTIISLAGQLIDQQIGFTMVNVFDPMSQIQLSITANLYYYLLLLIMIVNNMHYYIIKALVDSFSFIPISNLILKPILYDTLISFFNNYFIIAFRISLPVFAATLIVDVILGILARTAPQMNMFVIGMPLKLFVGLCILFITIGLMPTIANFLFNEMLQVMDQIIKGMSL